MCAFVFLCSVVEDASPAYYLFYNYSRLIVVFVKDMHTHGRKTIMATPMGQRLEV